MAFGRSSAGFFVFSRTSGARGDLLHRDLIVANASRRISTPGRRQLIHQLRTMRQDLLIIDHPDRDGLFVRVLQQLAEGLFPSLVLALQFR